jgi:hypothetical protein
MIKSIETIKFLKHAPSFSRTEWKCSEAQVMEEYGWAKVNEIFVIIMI